MLAQKPQHLVEPLDLFGKRRETLGPVVTTDEERARVTKHTRHVTHQLRRRAHTFNSAKRSEVFRRFALRFLRAIRERRKKVIQQFAFVFHKSERKSTRLNSSHVALSRMPSSA